MNSHNSNILLMCTGSVASIKIYRLLGLLTTHISRNIKIVSTKNALHFFNIQDVNIPNENIFLDENEWEVWNKRGDRILHIDLRNWADIGLIAPLDANTLSKIANGLCDNLLTSIVRAWDFNKPLFFCPAMNTHMYLHPITAEHIQKLKLFGFTEIPCTVKSLMCGETGIGAMAELEDIINQICEKIF